MPAIVALGSNVAPGQGTCADTVRGALAELADPRIVGAGIRLRAASRLWQTPCVPAGAGPDYINAAALLETTLTAPDLLARLHDLEHRFDRARTGRWAARTLDLDLIDHGGQIRPDRETQARWRALPPNRQPVDTPDRLITPHPRLQDRAFVLIPMREVAPHWRDPVSGQQIAQLVAALPPADIAAMIPVPEAATTAPQGLSSVSS